MMDNRPCNQLGEKGHKECIVKKVILFGLFSVAVYQIGDLLEGIKADRKWQCQVQQRNMCIEYSIDIDNKKIHIFKIAKQTEVKENTCCQKCFGRVCPVFAAMCSKLPPYCVIDEHRYQYQRKIFDIPPGIEKKRCKDEKCFPRLCQAFCIEVKIEKESDGKKEKYERV